METPAAVWAQAILWLYFTFVIFWFTQRWLEKHIAGLILLITQRKEFAINFYFFAVAPGTILHEFSHWLVARLLFVQTHEVEFFRFFKGENKPGPVTMGYVRISHTDPIRRSLIGLAPLPMGIAVLLILAAILKFNTGVASLTESDKTLQALLGLPAELSEAARQPLNFLWLYLVFSVGNGMLPSQSDRRPWLIGFILPGTIFMLMAVTGSLPAFSPETQLWLRQLLGNLTWIFGFAMLVNLFIVLLVFFLEWLVSKVSKRRVLYK